jgi:hypothetical protein
MSRYFVKGREFLGLERNGAKIILTRGYKGGTSIRRSYTIPNPLKRAFFLAYQARRHRKEGFSPVPSDFSAGDIHIVDLDAYILPGSYYMEDDPGDSFIEISAAGGSLRVRRGRTGGLGRLETLLEAAPPEVVEAKRKSLIEEAEAAGYKRIYSGSSFSLKVIDAEKADLGRKS